LYGRKRAPYPFVPLAIKKREEADPTSPSLGEDRSQSLAEEKKQ
jgi:hypothetical protein